jgi:pimeloyl-ACP methyl ester carboxylesterase
MIEHSITFGAGGGLVGTLCLPATGRISPLGQILFNAGILHRVGPHRLNVKLARRLAARGMASLRFDLSGLGDSARPGAENSFEKQAVLDIQAAMDALSRASGASRFALLGFCSGARHSYEAAAADARVAGIVLYDGQAFATTKSRLMRMRLMLQRHGWAKTVGGRLKRVLGRSSSAKNATPPVVSNSHEPTQIEYAQQLNDLLTRGTRVAVAFSGESVNYNYNGQFADAMRGLLPVEKIDLAYWPNLDHTVMLLSMQTQFLDWLESWAMSVAGNR